MAKIDQEEFAEGSRLADVADTLAPFLDPHLGARSQLRNDGKGEHWPLHRTILFAVSVSLVLWAVTAVVLRLVFGR